MYWTTHGQSDDPLPLKNQWNVFICSVSLETLIRGTDEYNAVRASDRPDTHILIERDGQ